MNVTKTEETWRNRTDDRLRFRLDGRNKVRSKMPRIWPASGWADKTAPFLDRSGLTMGREIVALELMRQDRPHMEISHGRANRDVPRRQTIGLQNLQAGSSLVPRTQPRPLEEKVRGAQGGVQAATSSKSRTSAVVGRTGAAKRKTPSERCKNFGPRTPNSRPEWTRFPRKLKKKVIDLPALVDNPSFAEIPAIHGYPAGVIALFLELVQLGVSLRQPAECWTSLPGSSGFRSPLLTGPQAECGCFGLALRN